MDRNQSVPPDSQTRPARFAEWCPSLAFVWMLILQSSAHAAVLEPAVLSNVQKFVVAAVQAQPIAQPPGPGAAVPRIQVDVGQPDFRLQLTPCAKAEPHLLNGVRLAGATRVGLKCVDGPKPWNISIPVTVRVYGRGLIALQSVNAGNPIQERDVAFAEVELISDPSAALTDLSALNHRILARSVSVGQSLRASHLKPRLWFAAGDIVKLVATGPGFSISTQGEALTPGIDGQPVRIKTEGGRIVSGTAVGDRQVAVSM